MPSPTRTAALLLACLLATPLVGRAAEKARLSFKAGKSKPADSQGFTGPRGERASRPQRATSVDKSYAQGMMKRHDANGNRVLEGDEWDAIKNAEKADYNGDKRITFDELVARVSMKRREDLATRSNVASGDRRSYRLITAQEKLPEGLPGWFTDKDRNGDGQVSMHEYSRRWTDSTARRFVGLDKNDDGLITPDEAASKR
ncbi:EF hand [Planctomycetes bacterium MalM25]|nr:EF hand [Planctomycetes bacterium MalM25]